MRGSKAKKIRRFAIMNNSRVRPILWRGVEVKYEPLKPTRVWAAPIPGLERKSAVFLGHVKMDSRCTRALYQEMKKYYRKANQFGRRMPNGNN